MHTAARPPRIFTVFPFCSFGPNSGQTAKLFINFSKSNYTVIIYRDTRHIASKKFILFQSELYGLL